MLRTVEKGTSALMRSTLLSGTLVLLAIAVGAGPAQAQHITSPYRYIDQSQALTVQATYIATNRGMLNLGPESGMAYGLSYTIRLGGPFNVDLAASFFPTRRAVMDTIPADSITLTNDPLASVTKIGEDKLGIALLTAALRFDITGPRTFHGLMPFVIFGGGVARQVYETGIADVHLISARRYHFGGLFAGQIGGGTDWFLTHRLTARLDVRDTFWRINIPAAFQRDPIPSREWVQNLHASLGLSWRF
ncbi:MAG: hypothetical protein P8Z36_00095 [Gemmatimonadota bacterium]|jgi:hypothetical protein